MPNGAPVCPVSRSQVPAGSPGLRLPPPARALDLPSLIATVNGIRNVLMMIAGPGPVTNNIYPPMAFGYPQLQQQNTAKPPGGQIGIRRGWEELSRDTEKMEIDHSEQETDESGTAQISKEDPSMRVFVERFNRIEYQSNPGAGSMDEFVWEQKHNPQREFGYGRG